MGLFKYFTVTRLFRWVCLYVAYSFPIPAGKRFILLKWGGVKFVAKKPERVCVYNNVLFDTVAPQLIKIGNHVAITAGCKILTHYVDPSQSGRVFRYGSVVIEDDVFIGVNTIICSSVTIGKGAIIGAGSVVTKDIPSNQVWAGVPARYIKDKVV